MTAKVKTAFSTSYGFFQFIKLPFGLVTAPANFSRMMQLLLKGLKDINKLKDDILEHTETWKDHILGVPGYMMHFEILITFD